MTVAEVMDMSIDEFRDWQVYEALEGPLGSDRLDLIAARICKTLVDVMVGTGHATLEDFIPEYGLPEEVQERRVAQLESEFVENAALFDVPDEDDEEVVGDGD